MRTLRRLWSSLAMLAIAAMLLSFTIQPIPSAHAAPLPLSLLDDDTFVSAPGFDHAAAQAFLDQQPGTLGSYQATLDGAPVPAAQLIVVAGLGNPHEVSPKVLLSLLEVSAGLVTSANPPAATLDRPFELLDQPDASFEAELMSMGALLRERFAAYDPALAPVIELADGSSYQRPPLPNAATYALEVALGRIATDRASFERLIGDGDGSFRATFADLFSAPLRASPQGDIQNGDTPFLYKPYAGTFNVSAFFDHNPAAGAFMRFDGATNYSYDGHNGTDFALPSGNTVLATADGVVIDVANGRTESGSASWCPGWAGYTPVTGMVVSHSVNGIQYTTTYWHLSPGAIGTNPRTGQLFKSGDTILRGEIVGISGDTGCSSGPHLHFGVKRNGYATDPYGWCGVGADPYPYPSSNIWAEPMSNPSPCPGVPADETPPQIVPTVIGPTGANGWYIGPTTVSWQVDDPDTGIASASGCDEISLSADTSSTTLTCTATNGAGMQASQSVTLKIDQTAPDLSASRVPVANAAGWSNSDVSVTFSCSDPTSGVATAPESPQTVSAEGTDQEVSATCVDNAGNSASATLSEINIDKHAPVITVISPRTREHDKYGRWRRPGKDDNLKILTYTRLDTFIPTWRVTDALSGVAQQQGTLDGTPVTSRQKVNLFFMSRGSHTLLIEAKDYADNAASKALSFNLVVTFESLIATNQRACDLGLIRQRSTCRSLQAKLVAAEHAQDHGQFKTARRLLESYIHHLQAQRGKGVSAIAYNLLSGDAQYLIDQIKPIKGGFGH